MATYRAASFSEPYSAMASRSSLLLELLGTPAAIDGERDPVARSLRCGLAQGNEQIRIELATPGTSSSKTVTPSPTAPSASPRPPFRSPRPPSVPGRGSRGTSSACGASASELVAGTDRRRSIGCRRRGPRPPTTETERSDDRGDDHRPDDEDRRSGRAGCLPCWFAVGHASVQAAWWCRDGDGRGHADGVRRLVASGARGAGDRGRALPGSRGRPRWVASGSDRRTHRRRRLRQSDRRLRPAATSSASPVPPRSSGSRRDSRRRHRSGLGGCVLTAAVTTGHGGQQSCHACQSRQRCVASTYEVFDMPTICAAS